MRESVHLHTPICLKNMCIYLSNVHIYLSNMPVHLSNMCIYLSIMPMYLSNMPIYLSNMYVVQGEVTALRGDVAHLFLALKAAESRHQQELAGVIVDAAQHQTKVSLPVSRLLPQKLLS